MANLALANAAFEHGSIPNLASANVALPFFCFGIFGLGNLRKGRLEEPGKKGAGGTRGDDAMDPVHDDKSKNPMSSEEAKLGNNALGP